MKYRKKPVVIEAMQLTPETFTDVLKWIGHAHLTADTSRDECVMVIRTLEGNHSARENDFIIKGVKGEFYPCKPDIFAQTYEKIEE